MKFKQHPERSFRHLVSMPFIYLMIVPVLVLDIFLELYHLVCFPLYGIPYVKRSDYIRLDRHKLKYLGFMDKINCTYCGYANGLARYYTAIAGETEKYWCGIKHAEVSGFKEPEHHKEFAKYGDEKEFEEKYCKLEKKDKKNKSKRFWKWQYTKK
jgi:hypothetical protein